MNAVVASSWTPERIEQLRTLAAEGLRPSQIAHRMHITELAVVGRCARLNIALGVTPPSKPKGRPRRDASPIVEEGDPMFGVAPPAREDAWKPIGEAEPVALLDTASTSCMWPIGEYDPKQQLCCGRPKAAKLPYCAEHTALAYQGGRYHRPGSIVRQFIRAASYYR
jgi:GcrA cell cycle regulator